jgi:hypothetical protein
MPGLLHRLNGVSEAERNEWISKRAYALWEEAGKPDGCDLEHWNQPVTE